MAWTYSFYAEVAAARGDVDEGRRRRHEVLAFYEDQPDDPFVVVARAYSRAKLGQLAGDLAAAEHWYRAATDGLSRIDRPIMRAMCLGMVAEFDERAGDWPATIAALEEAVEISDALGLRGFMGALQARLGWALLQVGTTDRAEPVYERALDSGRRLNYPMVIFLSLTGLAAVHRLNGREVLAESCATEALAWHEQLGPRRMANRIDAAADMALAAAVCCGVLAAIAIEAGDAERAQARLEQAEGFTAQAGGRVPCFQTSDLERVREALTS
jgi:tetratricopeptide (TPR) repeat protein